LIEPLAEADQARRLDEEFGADGAA
jgi:hypothetical protein